MNIHTTANSASNFAAVKAKQHAAWSSGDYAVVGTTLQIVGESLCEAVDLRAGQKVLDVAAGNGNATLAAARRFTEVVSTDYVCTLLERGRERSDAEGLPVTFKEADAENLPFEDESFDVVLSTFGVMFTPDQERAAAEMLRVCKRGGKIGMANWTPSGYIGQVFKTLGFYIPPAAGIKSPALWGTEDHVAQLFGNNGLIVSAELRNFNFRYRSAAHSLEVFGTYYGPILKALGALDDEHRKALIADFHSLIARFNRANDGTMVVPSDYLEVVLRKQD